MQMFLISWIFLLGIAFFIIAFFLESLVIIGSYLLIAVTLFLWGYIEVKKEMDRKKEEDIAHTERLLSKIPHTKRTHTDDLLTSLLIDERNSTFSIAIRDDIDEDFNYKSFPFSKLLEVAILEDGKVKYLFPKEGIIGGTINEDGQAIINVMDIEDAEFDEYEDDETDTIKKVTLKLVVDDLSNHTIEYDFLEYEDPIEKDSDDYKDSIKECSNWYQMISLAINQHKHEKRLVGPWV